VALTAVSSVNKQWVLDSGASYHLTSEFHNMINVRDLDRDIHITFGNGSAGKATGIGDVLLKGTPIILRDVLYVPDASANLMSVTCATANGAEFVFNKSSCDIKVNGAIIATAIRQDNGLYCIGNSGYDAPAHLATVKETPELWHRRFGHLGYDNLAKLVRSDMVSGINVDPQDFTSA
jgi:hypothetical protein